MSLMDNAILRIEQIENNWFNATTVAEDMDAIVKGLTKTDIATSFANLRNRLQNGKDSNQIISPIHYNWISTQLQNIETYVSQHIPSNPTGTIPGLLPFINNLEFGINAIIIDPASSKDVDSFSKAQNRKLTDLISKSEVVNVNLKNTMDLISKNQAASTEVAKILLISQDSSAKIQERDLLTTDATNRITETEKRSAALASQLEVHMNELRMGNSNIKSQQSELGELSTKLSTKLGDAQRLLEDANRVGLGGAFKTRKEDLRIPSFFWVTLFLISIVGLVFFAHSIQSLITTEAVKDWHVLLLRLPLSAPLVWLTWFAAKQYGYTRRIQEDYSFKVASALSYQGYKNETTHDPAMLKLLQESAISNFSANPLRIYDTKQNHGSPVMEMIGNLSPDKVTKPNK